VPRRSLADWAPALDRVDPVQLLVEGNADRLPGIAPIRLGRMAVDPFAFLRGAAEIMALDLAGRPATGIEVVACGDAHLANFGLFATAERRLVFDMNDFDEAHLGAWEWDLRRLAASLVVSARSNGQGEAAGRGAVQEAVRAYAGRMGELTELSALERREVRVDVDDLLGSGDADQLPSRQRQRVEKQVAKARRRDRFQALGRFTAIVDGERVIVDDPPLVQRLPADAFRDELLALWFEYRATVPDHVARVLDEYRFVDLALKVVGVGSVGTRALMVLLSGRVGEDPLFLQIKEAGPSVLAPHASAPYVGHQGQRVVHGQRLLQAAGDLFLGWGTAGGRDYYVRQLRDMKGGADPAVIRPDGLVAYGRLCGSVLAHAHARSAHPAPIAGYLGGGGRAADALEAFAATYADQTERDHAALVTAIRTGAVEAALGV
jgi:uncharacterized protein (DUF2252 family)